MLEKISHWCCYINIESVPFFFFFPFQLEKINAHFFSPLKQLLYRGLVYFALVIWIGCNLNDYSFYFPTLEKQGKKNSYWIKFNQNISFITCCCYLSTNITCVLLGCHVSQLQPWTDLTCSSRLVFVCRVGFVENVIAIDNSQGDFLSAFIVGFVPCSLTNSFRLIFTCWQS